MGKWEWFILTLCLLLCLAWVATGETWVGLAAGFGVFGLDALYQWVTKDDGW